MSTLNRELVFLILRFLNEEGLQEAARMLEQDSGFYFNMNYFEEMILGGNWDVAEKYLSGFIKLDDNKYSTKIYFEIRKQNFLEALDKNDRGKGLDILMNDLKVFAPKNEDLFAEMTQLLTINDIREHGSLSTYGDTESARKLLMLELKKLIEAHPLFCNKLTFPIIHFQRLRRLINQALNWQHIHCRYPQPNPIISTLFEDHVCLPPEDNFISMSTSKDPPATSMLAQISSVCLESTPSAMTNPEITCGTACLSNSGKLAMTSDGSEDTSVVSKNMSPGTPDEETSAVTNPIDLPKSPLKNNVIESCKLICNAELPKKVVRLLNEGSSPMSMDFHPVQQTLLLVGTSMGDIRLWEVSSREKLLSRNFKVWDIGACTMKFKATLLKDPCVSVNRVAWSPEGSLFGVAYSKHIVQIYSYLGLGDARQKLEIDAHVGGVNDLAFSALDNNQLVITCGDDKAVKVWDVNTSVRMYNFEGHDSPVYSLCPQIKEQIHFIFSVSVDGNIKAWLYDNLGARVDYDALGLGRTRIAYSADDRRLFSCGTSKNGESFLVEWNESEGSIKKIYNGLQKNSLAVVPFDIMKNQFLAAGDEHVIKIWDMDRVDLFTTIHADGGLPANPHIRFNKDGTLLAVFANENIIKILASESSLPLVDIYGNCSTDASRVLSDTFEKLAINPTSPVACDGVANEAPKNEDSKSLENLKYEDTEEAGHEILEIKNPLQCQLLWISSPEKSYKISGLVYNNAGNAILALTLNGFHLLWKWPVNDLNSNGKATTEASPQLWEPKNCPGPMTNDLTGTNHEGILPCFALSRNDSYLVSASGGKISVFNMLTFKTMLSIMPPPPATTSLAFLPQDNNIIAVGREDSTIIIYNVRLAKVISKLVGHSKRVTSLAFSKALNVLVSSGADAQILAWDVEGWEKQRSRFLQIPEKNKTLTLLDTHVQFHQDQMQFLAVHGSYLAIFEAETLDCLNQWVPVDPAPISWATFSSCGLMVYACAVDGTIYIFDASQLELRCRIISDAYLLWSSTSSLFGGTNFDAYPVVIAAHPQKPNQFAVGLSNGGVLVFEPRNTTGKWITFPSDEDGSASTEPFQSDV